MSLRRPSDNHPPRRGSSKHSTNVKMGECPVFGAGGAVVEVGELVESQP